MLNKNRILILWFSLIWSVSALNSMCCRRSRPAQVIIRNQESRFYGHIGCCAVTSVTVCAVTGSIAVLASMPDDLRSANATICGATGLLSVVGACVWITGRRTSIVTPMIANRELATIADDGSNSSDTTTSG